MSIHMKPSNFVICILFNIKGLSCCPVTQTIWLAHYHILELQGPSGPSILALAMGSTCFYNRKILFIAGCLLFVYCKEVDAWFTIYTKPFLTHVMIQLSGKSLFIHKPQGNTNNIYPAIFIDWLWYTEHRYV